MIEPGTILYLTCALVVLALVSCAADSSRQDATEIAAAFIAEMDARPADQQVPNWDYIRALMTRKPPAVGTVAPDFDLETRDGTDRIRLSQFRGKQPVVLIFGSWT